MNPTPLYSNSKNSYSTEWPNFSFFYFISLALILSLFILTANQYIPPLGSDGILFPWPAAVIIAEAPFLTKFKVSIASFIGEDHLAPVYFFYSYFISLFGNSPAEIYKIAPKIEIILVIASSIILFHKLWRNPKKTLLFSLMLTLSLPMTWKNMIFFVHNLSVFLSIWCFYFLHQYLSTRKIYYLWILAGLFISLTFSFESGFAAMPLLAVYTILYVFQIDGLSAQERIKNIFYVGIVLLICFLPYLFIHQSLYGFPLPISRLGITFSTDDLFNSILSYFLAFSSWNFDVYKIAYNISKPLAIIVGIISIILFFAVIKTKLYTAPTKIVFFCFCSQWVAILSTGRSEDGLWLFVGLIYLMLLSDVLATYLFEKHHVNILYIFIIVVPATFLVFPFIKTAVFETANYYFKLENDDQTAAYKAINGPYRNLTLIQLPGARVELHPLALWMGNKIFNGEKALEYYEKQNMLMGKNINFVRYSNLRGRPFSAFEKYFIPVKNPKDIKVLRDKNLFTSYTLDSHNNEILRAFVIPYAEKDIFNINIPKLEKYGSKSDNISITLNFRSADNFNKVPKVELNGRTIEKFHSTSNTLTFTPTNLLVQNILILGNRPRNRLVSISVRLEKNSLKKPASNRHLSPNIITLTSRDSPCTYSIKTGDGQANASGTMEANTTKDISFLSLEITSFPVKIRSTPHTLKKNLIKPKTYTLFPDANLNKPIKVC